MDALNNILVCGYSNSASLINSGTQPIMAKLDSSGTYFWQNQYVTVPASTSMRVCAFKTDTSSRIIGVTYDKMTVLMIDGADGTVIKAWAIQG